MNGIINPKRHNLATDLGRDRRLSLDYMRYVTTIITINAIVGFIHTTKEPLYIYFQYLTQIITANINSKAGNDQSLGLKLRL